MLTVTRNLIVHLVVYLIGAAILTLCSGTAHGQSYTDNSKKFERICNTLERSQVDCACVGKRMATFLHVSPTREFSIFTEARYSEVLGIKSNLDSATEAAFGNDAKVMDIIAAYDPYGGHEIAYEEGCVIKGAPRTPISPVPLDDVYKTDFDQCANSTGQARFCQCFVAAKAEILTKAEYAVSYTPEKQYEGFNGTMDEFHRKRASDLGLSNAAYDVLRSQMKTKLDAYADSDSGSLLANRCFANIYGENFQSGIINQDRAHSDEERAGPPLGLEVIDVSKAAPKLQTGQEFLADIENLQMDAYEDGLRMSEGVEEEANAIQNSAEIAQIKDGRNLPSPSEVLASGCAGEAGRSPTYCQCLRAEFERAIPASMSVGAKRMAAMMLVGSGLPPVEGAQISNNTKPEDQQAAAMSFPDIMGLPETCEAEAQVASVDQALSRAQSTRELYLEMCEMQFEDMGSGICTCAADHFKKNLNENEWRMLIDIQVAELKGEDDAFAKFASDVGMTRQQAEQAMMSNPRLMQTMMGMAPACMGFGLGLD